MNGYYILNGKEPKPVDDVMEWAQKMNGMDRIVEQTDFDNVKVSTVFLGLDHSFFPDSKPQLFETMIFGGEHDMYQERYSTWDEAVIGHKAACEMVKAKEIQ